MTIGTSSRMVCLCLMLACAGSARGSTVTLDQVRLGNVFVQPEPVTVLVTSPLREVTWVISDHRGSRLQSGVLPLESNRGELRLAGLPPGYFELEVRSPDDDGPGARTSLAVLDPLKRVDRRFGTSTHFAQGWTEDIVPLISLAGLGHVRDEQYWADVEALPGEIAFPNRFTSYMAELARHDIEPLIVLSFANPHYDAGLSPYSDAGRAAFARYARAVVERYGSQIRAIEVWNEYNGSFCAGPCEGDRAGYYTPMLVEAYRQIKQIRPDIIVGGGAAVKIAVPYLEDVLNKGGLDVMDAVVVHPYGSVPEGVAAEIGALQDIIRRYNGGRGKPVWVTEFGEGGTGHGERAEAARFLVRMITALLSVGVERVGWYLLRDDRDFVGMGLLHHPDSALGRYAPAPAYVAYAQLIRRLAGRTFVRREETDGRLHVYVFVGDDGKEVRVLWAPQDSVWVDLRADGERLELVDMVGRDHPLPSENGTTRLKVGAEPVYVLGPVDEVVAAWPDRLIADSLEDHADQQGVNGWFYGHYDGDGRGEGRGQAPYTGADFEPMIRVADRWSYQWGDESYPWLSLGARSGHPSSAQDVPVWAVRRWTSGQPRTVTVRGSAEASSSKGDGRSLMVTVDGKEIFSETIGGHGARSINFEFRAKVGVGSSIDFALTPGPGTDTNFDGTTFAAQIIEVKG